MVEIPGDIVLIVDTDGCGLLRVWDDEGRLWATSRSDTCAWNSEEEQIASVVRYALTRQSMQEAPLPRGDWT